jgi:iron(III) transport system ATP-binding protein
MAENAFAETPSFAWGKRGTAGSAIPSALSLTHLSHRYTQEDVIKDLSLEIKSGEIVALLGASGCGKSTLLRLIAGLERPHQGQIFMDKLEVSSQNNFLPPHERGIGFVFQDYALFPHLTCIGNVKFGLKHLPREEAITIALQALARVGLADKAYAMPQTLSGGMQQRVALARAIAPRPSILLMDEPFSGLDRRLRDDVREETLAVIQETRATTLIVTHDPEEAMRMADKIVLLKNGTVLQQGTAAQLYSSPSSLEVARFFSDINVLNGKIAQGFVHTPLGKFATTLPENTLAYVAIRPESLELEPLSGRMIGRMSKLRFAGEINLAEVLVEGLERPLKVRLRANAPLAKGQDVGINIKHEEVLVFATNNG